MNVIDTPKSVTLKVLVWLLLITIAMGLIVEFQITNDTVSGITFLGSVISITYLVFFFNQNAIRLDINKIHIGKINLNSIPDEFVVLDFETTGLNSDKNKILEIGAIKVIKSTGKLARYQTLIKLKGKVPEKITEITGITTEMAKRQGKPIDIAAQELVDFIGNRHLVAFNVNFDLPFLYKALNDSEIKFDYYSNSCALQMARKAWPDFQNHKLSTLARKLKLNSKGHHRALKDAELALQVYIMASKRLEL